MTVTTRETAREASPVHFFWGSFDWVMVEAYNQEESSAGWCADLAGWDRRRTG